MNRETLKRLFGSLLFRILMIVLILYVLYHVALALSDRILTDVVTEGEDRVTYSGAGTLYRDEKPLYLTANGALLSYRFDNGERVNSAATVLEAVYLPTESDTYGDLSARLDAVDTRIRALRALMRLSDGDTLADLETLTAAAERQCNVLLAASTGGASLRQVCREAETFLDDLNRISALTDPTASLPLLLANQTSRRSAILQSAGGSVHAVTLGDLYTDAASGYFYHADTVDGYEALYGTASLATLTLAEYESRNALALSAPPAAVPGKVVCGKIAVSSLWYLALPLPASVAETLTEGSRYDVTFPEAEDATFSMVLDRLSIDESGCLGLFSSDELPKDFRLSRFSDVRLAVSAVQGLRVPSTALTTADGEEGVYVLDGGRVCFRRIRVLLRGDGYVLVYTPTGEERQNDEYYGADNYLALRDIVITKGEDLYDGKYIN